MSRRPIIKLLIAVFIVIAALGGQPAYAHSRGMATLDIHGHGRRLLLTWVFYDDELPADLVLPDGSGTHVSLRDPQQLKEGLGKVAEVAFQLKLGKQILAAPAVSQVIVLPDKTCLIILTYSLDGAGPLEVRAPVLQILPPNYLINARFMGPDGKRSSTLMSRDAPSLTAMVGGGEDAGAPEVGVSPFRSAFTEELGTAWIHTNWILLGLLVLLCNPARRAALLLLAMFAVRMLLVDFALAPGHAIPGRIPGVLMCLPIIMTVAVAVQSRERHVPFSIITIGSAVIYTIYDLDSLSLGGQGGEFASLLGYQSGFIAGFLLAMAIILVIGAELSKSLQFRAPWWRTRICWTAAGISAWMSIYSLLAK